MKFYYLKMTARFCIICSICGFLSSGTGSSILSLVLEDYSSCLTRGCPSSKSLMIKIMIKLLMQAIRLSHMRPPGVCLSPMQFTT